MRKASYSILGCVVGTVLAALALPGVHADDWTVAVLVGVVLGAVYLVARPILKLLALPFALLSLGLIYVLLDAALLWFVVARFEGYAVESFGWAVTAAAVVNLSRSLLRVMAR